jgi:hypothetical protein
VLGTDSTQFAGQSLSNVGGPNFWAPNETLVTNGGAVNSGTTFVQHSQVTFLTVNFSEAVTINTTNLASVFSLQASDPITAVSWASGVATITTSTVNGFTAGQSVTISGAGGFNGTFSITPSATNPLQFTYALATNPGAVTLGTNSNVTFAVTLGTITTNGTTSGTTLIGVTQAIIKFAAGSAGTFGFAARTIEGQSVSVGLNDADYFLSTNGADITSNGVFLDTAHNGNPSDVSGTEIDEFWRLFGDDRGVRAVDQNAVNDFKAVNGSTSGAKGSKYVYYEDFNLDGNIDVSNTIDQAAILQRLNKNLGA